VTHERLDAAFHKNDTAFDTILPESDRFHFRVVDLISDCSVGSVLLYDVFAWKDLVSIAQQSEPGLAILSVVLLRNALNESGRERSTAVSTASMSAAPAGGF
jgi:hypothetical protein